MHPETEASPESDAFALERAAGESAASATEPAGTSEPEPASETPEPETPETPPDAALEALLFASQDALAAPRLAQLVGSRKGEVLAAIDRLNVFYAETGRSFRIAPLAGGYQLVTTPEHAEVVARLHKEKAPTKLSRAALETLSIVAFKQPVTRAEVDSIRGVSASDGVIRHLMERGLVRISGRAETPGRPLLYGTTREFLAHFGLQAVSDLPRPDELAALLAGETRSTPAEEPIDVAPEAAAAAHATSAPQSAAARVYAADDDADLDDDDDEFDADLRLRDRTKSEDPPSAAPRESHSGKESDEDDGDPPPE